MLLLLFLVLMALKNLLIKIVNKQGEHYENIHEHAFVTPYEMLHVRQSAVKDDFLLPVIQSVQVCVSERVRVKR